MNTTEKLEVKSDKKEVTESSLFPKIGIIKLHCTLADKWDALFLVLAIIGAVGMGVAFPLFSLVFGKAVSDFGALNPSDIVSTIKGVSLDLVYLAIGFFVATALNTTFSYISSERYIKKIKLEYFRSLLRQEQGFFDQKNAFEYSTKIEAQIKTIASGLGTKITNSIMTIVTFITSFIVGFIVYWKLSLILAGTLPFIILTGAIMVKTLMNAQSKSRLYFEKAGGIAEEILYNIKTVASFSNFEYEKSRFNHMVEESYERGKFGGIASSLSRGLMLFSIFGSYAIAIGLGGWYLSIKEEKYAGKEFQVGDIFTIIFTIVIGGLQLGKGIPNIQAIAAACDASREFFYLYERKPEIDLSQSVEKPDKDIFKGQIKFRDVTFAYPSKKERNIIEKMNLNLTQEHQRLLLEKVEVENQQSLI